MPVSPLLVFDFDGTVALGDGPVRAYARLAAAQLDETAGKRLIASFEHRIAALDEAGHQPLDGYDLVAGLGVAEGLSPAALSTAYLESRTVLGTADAPITAPDGLREFLMGARETATIVLATNAPGIRIGEALEGIGLADVFDIVHTAAGKPGEFAHFLRRLTGDAAADGALPQLLSIGDVWANDLEPAHRLGFDTALVGPLVPPDATPTFAARQLPDLFPAIFSWLQAGTTAGARLLPSVLLPSITATEQR